MTFRRMKNRRPESSGDLRSTPPAARAVSPRSAPDDSGAFGFADTRYQRQSGHILLGRRESRAAVDQRSAEVVHPCVCCKRGLERCDVCQGRGRSDDRDTCDHCLGTGYRSCDFCGGSGMVARDSVPAELRVSAALELIRKAARQLDASMNRTASPLPADEPLRSLQENGRALLRMNRLAAMFEDGLHLLQMEMPTQPGGRDNVSQEARFCLKRALDCQQCMREIVRRMAVSAQRLAEMSTPQTEDREIAAKRADFYASLLRRSGLFTGTGFERVLLNAAIRRLREASAAPIARGHHPREEP